MSNSVFVKFVPSSDYWIFCW